MLMIALFIIVNIWKQSRCLSTDEWINKMICLYSGMLFGHERNKILIHAAKWMNLQNIMFSERNE